MGHEVEFALCALPPVELEGCEEVGEGVGVEDHALEDGFDDGFELFAGEVVLGGDLGELPGLFLAFEEAVVVLDLVFVEGGVGLEGVDVFGDVLAFVDELGFGGDESDELIAGHFGFLGVLLGVAGDELHDVVVINGGGGEEDEFEVELVEGGAAGAAGFVALIAEALGGFEVGAAELAELVAGEDGFDFLFLEGGEVGVLVELGLDALDFLEAVDELGAGVVAFEVGDGFGLGGEALGVEELVELGFGFFEALDDGGGFIHEPDFAGLFGLGAGEEGDGFVHVVLLSAEVEDVSVGFGGVEDAVGAAEGLDEAMVAEGFVHVEGVEVFGVEAGEEHIDDDGDVDFFGAFSGEVGVGVLLVFDALLDIFVVGVEVVEGVVGLVGGVVVGDDLLEGGFFLVGLGGVVGLFLGEVFLELADIGVAIGGGREDGGDAEGGGVGVLGGELGLAGLEEVVVGDGVVDAGGGEEGVEAAVGGGGVVFGEDGVDDGLFGVVGGGGGEVFAFGFEVVDVEAQDVAVFDGVGDGVGVEFLLEGVLGGFEGLDVAVDLFDGGVLLEDGGSGEAEQLGVGEEVADGLVGIAELGAVAFVEDDDEALAAEGFEEVGVGGVPALLAFAIAGAVFVEGEAEFLDGGDDDFVGVVGGEEAADEGGGVGVFFDAARLEAVELFAGLAVEVFAVHDEEAFVDAGIGFEEGGGFEGGEGFAAAGGVPDVAIAAVFLDAADDAVHGVDLVGAHHHELLLAGDEDGVAADHVAEGAFGQEGFGEVVEVGDFGVVFGGELIDGEEAFFGVEAEVAVVVVGEVPGVGPVADDEELNEAEEGAGVAVAGVVFIVHDLLHGAAGTDAEVFQLDLHGGDAVDEEHDIVAVVAVVGVDAELVDDFEGVFAPVFDVDEGVVQRGAVVAGEVVDFAEGAGGGIDVGGDDVVEKAVEFAIGELDAVESFEFGAEVLFEGGAVADVGADGVFEVAQAVDEADFDVFFAEDGGVGGGVGLVVGFGGGHDGWGWA